MGSRRLAGQIQKPGGGTGSSYTFTNGVSESGGVVSLDLSYVRGNAYTFSNGLTHNGSGGVSLGGTFTPGSTISFLGNASVRWGLSDVNSNFLNNFSVYVRGASHQLFLSSYTSGNVENSILLDQNQSYWRVSSSTVGTNWKQIFISKLTNVGIRIDDNSATRGCYYNADYSVNGISTHGNRWIPDYGAVTSQIGGNAVAAAIQSPGAGQHLQRIVWNDTNQQYEFDAASAGGGSPGGLANELQKNDGASGFTGTGVFSTSDGSLSLGTGLTGTERSINAGGTDALQNLVLRSNGSGSTVRLQSLSGVYTHPSLRVYTSTAFSGTYASISRDSAENRILFSGGAVDDLHFGFTNNSIASAFGGGSIDAYDVYLKAMNVRSDNASSSAGNTILLKARGYSDSDGLVRDESLDGSILVETDDDEFIHIDGRRDFTPESGASVTLTEAHRGRIVRLTNDNPTVTLSDLTDGFECVLLWVPSGTPGTGTITGHTTLNGDAGDIEFTNPYALVWLCHESGNDWIYSGDLSGGGIQEIATADTSVVIDETYNGKMLVLTHTANQDVVLSDLPDGFQLQVLKTGATGTVSFSGYTTFNSIGGVDEITDQFGMVYLVKRGSNVWFAKGDLT